LTGPDLLAAYPHFYLAKREKRVSALARHGETTENSATECSSERQLTAIQLKILKLL